MRSWRIVIEEAALDRSCEGARKSGGHWHREGLPALYGAATVELSVLEKFVHYEEDEPSLVLVAIDLPDDSALGLDVDVNRLPNGWHDPEGHAAAAFGTAFLKQGSHLYMRVPSCIIHEASNLVINPAHPAYEHVQLQIVRPFSFDPRMFKR